MEENSIHYSFASLIKVQRPDILPTIALDMHLLRRLAPVLRAVFKSEMDINGLVDEWGRAFVKELDYRSGFCSVCFSMDRLQLARKK